MNHRRHRPKNRRAGCLLCKPHKANGIKGTRGAKTMQQRRSDMALADGIGSLVSPLPEPNTAEWARVR